MKRRNVVAIVTAAVVLSALGFVRYVFAQHSLPAPERLQLAKKVSVPLTLFGGRPVIEVKVNGKGPFRFIFDTGAAGSVISNELAHELNLPALQHAQMGRPGSSSPLDAYVTKVESLEMGEARAEGVAAVYSDLSLLTALNKGQDVPRGVISSVN